MGIAEKANGPASGRRVTNLYTTGGPISGFSVTNCSELELTNFAFGLRATIRRKKRRENKKKTLQFTIREVAQRGSNRIL